MWKFHIHKCTTYIFSASISWNYRKHKVLCVSALVMLKHWATIDIIKVFFQPSRLFSRCSDNAQSRNPILATTTVTTRIDPTLAKLSEWATLVLVYTLKALLLASSCVVIISIHIVFSAFYLSNCSSVNFCFFYFLQFASVALFVGVLYFCWGISFLSKCWRALCFYWL